MKVNTHGLLLLQLTVFENDSCVRCVMYVRCVRYVLHALYVRPGMYAAYGVLPMLFEVDPLKSPEKWP
jgi:hypothetical protein